MAKTRVVLDTNILVSALVYGGNPRKILRLVIKKRISGIVSLFILWELNEILTKKFAFNSAMLKLAETKIKKKFALVNPSQSVNVLIDDPDNRILEAALEGGCQYIVTGDKELLRLKVLRDIKIITASEFLKVWEQSKFTN